jgi:hypothetical protein
MLASVDNVVLVQVVNGLEDLSDCFCGILFCEFTLLAYAIEKLSAGCELSDDIVLVLRSPVRDVESC